jgi:hypothetical protein
MGIISVKIIDALGDSLTGTIGIRIAPQRKPLEIVSPEKIDIIIGDEIRWVPAASGGEGNYQWKIKGQLPDGLKFENNTLQGKLTNPGNWQLTLLVTDKITRDTASKSFVITAKNPSLELQEKLHKALAQIESQNAWIQYLEAILKQIPILFLLSLLSLFIVVIIFWLKWEIRRYIQGTN